MVNYKLGFVSRKEKKEVKSINLKKLEKIDELTSDFDNENQLKLYLLQKEEDMTQSDLNSKIQIIYKYKEEFRKLPIIYSDMKKYLDMYYLRSKIYSLSKDINFLEKLARHYSLGSDKYNNQAINVSDIRMYISDVRISGGETFESSTLMLALEDLYYNACFKKPNKISGETQINYRGLRDLAVFIYKYDEVLRLQNQEQNQINQEATPVNLKNEIARNQELKQISLFDDYDIPMISLDKEEEYDDYEEPIFPPNCREEREYQEYLDNLPDEFSDNDYQMERRKRR